MSNRQCKSSLEDDLPLVSVVIPVFNCGTTLSECLDSITRQQYHNLEIIIIDDQSSDDSGDIADKYAEKDSRISVIHKRNAGPGVARNDGLRVAHGKYLQFVDADDILDSLAISTTIEIAERTDADLVSFDFQLFDNKQVTSRSRAVPQPYPDIEQSSGIECLQQIYTGHLGYFSWAFLYRLDRVRSCSMRYPQDVHLLEDMLMLNRLLRHDLKVAYCPKPLYWYRNNAGSLSHTARLEHALQGFEVVTAVKRMCEAENLRLYARSAVPILLYLDSLLPFGDPNHRLVRAEAKYMASVGGMSKLERSVLFRLFLTTTGIMDIIRRL